MQTMGRKLHDFEINNLIKSILSQHKIDLSKVNFTSRGGVVYFEGIMKLLDHEALDSVPLKVMEVIDLSINAIQDVKRVRYNLLNLSKTDVGWRYVKFIKSDKQMVWKVGGGGGITKHRED
ncbi:MAG: hypothetical protein D6805_09975 [Planctomycetota bacterium]|nr:MAG: hypothetical protein D6805_09975 [Planctomycetota bacterium]